MKNAPDKNVVTNCIRMVDITHEKPFLFLCGHAKFVNLFVVLHSVVEIPSCNVKNAPAGQFGKSQLLLETFMKVKQLMNRLILTCLFISACEKNRRI